MQITLLQSVYKAMYAVFLCVCTIKKKNLFHQPKKTETSIQNQIFGLWIFWIKFEPKFPSALKNITSAEKDSQWVIAFNSGVTLS